MAASNASFGLVALELQLIKE
ncbi:uncharacterized protein G2W53_012998 [Senna tora]|uniref:Uncharacterized protein n=1 Tax=Senna tora TaxID=362788 RepID=A0A834U1X8_9FABA|nr:uncharacterized protein G2W53_012998 [Senna tora]